VRQSGAFFGEPIAVQIWTVPAHGRGRTVTSGTAHAPRPG